MTFLFQEETKEWQQFKWKLEPLDRKVFLKKTLLFGIWLRKRQGKQTLSLRYFYKYVCLELSFDSILRFVQSCFVILRFIISLFSSLSVSISLFHFLEINWVDLRLLPPLKSDDTVGPYSSLSNREWKSVLEYVLWRCIAARQRRTCEQCDQIWRFIGLWATF